MVLERTAPISVTDEMSSFSIQSDLRTFFHVSVFNELLSDPHFLSPSATEKTPDASPEGHHVWTTLCA